jgi:hypothetical protein
MEEEEKFGQIIALKLNITQIDQSKGFTHARHQLLHDVWATQAHSLNRLLKHWRVSKTNLENMSRLYISFTCDRVIICPAEMIDSLPDMEKEKFVKENCDEAIHILKAHMDTEKDIFGQNGLHTASTLQKFIDMSTDTLPQFIAEKQSSQSVPLTPHINEQNPDAMTIQAEFHGNSEVFVPVPVAHGSTSPDNNEGIG